MKDIELDFELLLLKMDRIIELLEMKLYDDELPFADRTIFDEELDN